MPLLDAAVRRLRDSGYEVVLGDCLLGGTHISAPAADRAAELMAMLLDPAVSAVVPPWGGETGIDLLPLLDFDALRAAEPTWFAGYSDTSTLLTPITLLTGTATLHSGNLVDVPNRLPGSFSSWLDVAGLAAGSVLRQESSALRWRRLDGGNGELDLSGRLIGGCIETITHITGSPFGGTSALGPTIVYVEACEDGAFSICRALHGMRLAGFFDSAVAVLIGRSSAPDAPSLTQDDAVRDALGMLGVPIVADVEFGHVPPQLTIVNGALGRLRWSQHENVLEQTLA